LTILLLVAPSLPSSSGDSTAFIMAFSYPPFPLAQSTKFEVGGTLGVDYIVDEDNICCESGVVYFKVYDLD